jgi:cytochrome P450
MTNLQYTFGIVFKSLEVFGDIFSGAASKEMVVDLNEAMIRVTFDTIMESAFGINYHTQTDHDPTSRTELSDGLLYLQENEVHLREGFRRTVNPFRKYCFWLVSEMSQYNTALTNMKAILTRIVKHYEDTHPEGYDNDTSIMGHLMRHNYKDPRQRIADMNTFVVAGHETTSHTLTMMFVCICKNAEVKGKL